MSNSTAYGLPGFLAVVCSVLLLLMASGAKDVWYSQGVTDCKAGKENYIITVTPEGSDTTYVHP